MRCSLADSSAESGRPRTADTTKIGLEALERWKTEGIIESSGRYEEPLEVSLKFRVVGEVEEVRTAQKLWTTLDSRTGTWGIGIGLWDVGGPLRAG